MTSPPDDDDPRSMSSEPALPELDDPPEFSAPSALRRADGPRPRAVLVGIQLGDTTAEQLESSLAELGRLADTLGLEVVGRVTQRREALAAPAGIGGGKLLELARLTGGPGHVPSHSAPGANAEPLGPAPGAVAEAEQARVVLVDHDLSPRQTRNLELATDAEVLDRSMVVVSIFQRHAHTRQARLQVEIARLSYLAPRLRESGAGEDRKRGGVGGRGAGETSLELGRRQVRDRIAELKRELATLEKTEQTQRRKRRETNTVAIVGYTNAGKSSLMRRLTGDRAYVADQLFATLDTTVRTLKPETAPKILISDTVGFIKNLPHDLVASFRSTLQEATDAGLLLHLVDGSDPAFRDQIRVTEEVLEDLAPKDDQPRLLVLNKADRLSEAERSALGREFPDALVLSAHRPEDVLRLHARIVAEFEHGMVEHRFDVPYELHARVALLHERCRVLTQRHTAAGTSVLVRAPREVIERLTQSFAAPTPKETSRGQP